MQKKNELLKQCVEVMKRANVDKWYGENLESKPQVETVEILAKGVNEGKLTVQEALSIAFTVGLQWSMKLGVLGSAASVTWKSG